MDMAMYRRAIASTLTARLAEAPVVRLSGSRAAGKTTTCVAEIERQGGTVLRLDDPDERAAADPHGYVSGHKPAALVDEFHVLLDAGGNSRPRVC
jgi:hypothetical protein